MTPDTERTYTVIDDKMVVEWPGGLKAEYTLRTLNSLIAEYTNELARFRDYRKRIRQARRKPKALRPERAEGVAR